MFQVLDDRTRLRYLQLNAARNEIKPTKEDGIETLLLSHQLFVLKDYIGKKLLDMSKGIRRYLN